MKKIETMLAATAMSAAMMMTLPATAAVIITQSAAPAPTYATTLNFDEPGGPTGSVPSNSYAAIGISSIVGGSSDLFVGNLTGTFPWAPNSNVGYGNFGIHMIFSPDLTSFSAQIWDNGGPAGPFGGGMFISVSNNGAEVGFGGFSPAWGGLGNTWFNITTTGGSVFDQIDFGGNAFGFPETFTDNMSWNAVPAPGALALLGLAGFTCLGRRRR